MLLSLSLGRSGCIQALQAEEFVLGAFSYQRNTVVQENHLVDKVLLLILHIKLNLMRNFMRNAVNVNSQLIVRLSSKVAGIDPRGAER